MAKHLVKCKICGIEFDLNQEQGVIAGARRYAHYSCYPEGELVPMVKPKSKDEDLDELKKYIKKIYGDKANWVLINKQIKKFHTDNKYSYTGMLKSLKYFYEVKKNNVDKSNGGIGIVEYCYQDAYNYYLAIYIAQQQNEEKTFIEKVKEFVIKPPQPKKRNKMKLFNLEDENE